MPLSMNLSHHYVTQGSAYDRLCIGKRLTDRRIAQLQKKGWYGNGIMALQRKEKIAKKRAKTNIVKLLMDFAT